MWGCNELCVVCVVCELCDCFVCCMSALRVIFVLKVLALQAYSCARVLFVVCWNIGALTQSVGPQRSLRTL